MLVRSGRGEIDYVTLTSSNIARALQATLDETARDRIRRSEIALVSISPVTSTTIRELGWSVAAEATTATTAGVIEALVRYVQKTDERH